MTASTIRATPEANDIGGAESIARAGTASTNRAMRTLVAVQSTTNRIGARIEHTMTLLRKPPGRGPAVSLGHATRPICERTRWWYRKISRYRPNQLKIAIAPSALANLRSVLGGRLVNDEGLTVREARARGRSSPVSVTQSSSRTACVRRPLGGARAGKRPRGSFRRPMARPRATSPHRRR